MGEIGSNTKEMGELTHTRENFLCLSLPIHFESLSVLPSVI